MAIKYGVVELLVRVAMEVPDHVIERDKGRYEAEEMSEKDLMHDYAVGCIQRDVQVLHGQNEDTDWITLSAEVIECDVDEKFRDR